MTILDCGKRKLRFEKIHLIVANLALFLLEELHKKANFKNFMDLNFDTFLDNDRKSYISFL